MAPRANQTDIRTRLAHLRGRAGLTQEEVAWAIGIPIATYIRLERGQQRNPRLGWLVNASFVLDCGLDELIEPEMENWHRFGRSEPPPTDWFERPEVLARIELFEQEHG